MAVKTNVVLVPFWSHFGDVLGSFWCHFRPWGVPGVPVGSFQWLDGVLGGPFELPGGSLGVLGRPLGVSGAPLGRPCAHRGGPVSIQSAVLGPPGHPPAGPRGEKVSFTEDL